MRRRLLESNIIYHIGDIVFVNNTTGTMLPVNKANINKYIINYTPIGIVVNVTDAEVIICSLVLMSCDTPAVGDINRKDRNNTTMFYGPSMTISGIPNCKNESEALADFNGSNHTKVLADKRGNKDYSKWTPNNLTYFDYPAPSCCDIFYTVATEQRSWYLPAYGELNYLKENYDIIEESLSALQDSEAICITMENDRYWSSSDYGGLYAWNMIPKTGAIDYNNKQTNRYNLRAFYKIQL